MHFFANAHEFAGALVIGAGLGLGWEVARWGVGLITRRIKL